MELKRLKVLAICKSIDLGFVGGCTPAWWQLFEAMNHLGVEFVVAPMAGKAVRSLWWSEQENPLLSLDRFYEHLPALGISACERLLKGHILDVWKRHIDRIIEREKGISVVVLFGIWLNRIEGLAKYIRSKYNLPIFIYEADLPTYLYGNSRGFFDRVDISQYDGIILNSEGVITKLRELGFSNLFVVDFGADPNLFNFNESKQDIDVGFYGYGLFNRREAIKYLMIEPSKALPQFSFRVQVNENMDLGLVKYDSPNEEKKDLVLTSIKPFCNRSKINLNITRESFAKTYASSTARLFELASMECCIVSNPVYGLEKWFKPNAEIFVARDSKEAVELYNWLISSNKVRRKVGEAARNRVLKEHTYSHRAKEFIEILSH
jgi:glycosyltransferase involved in cell wall biosynthesis